MSKGTIEEVLLKRLKELEKKIDNLQSEVNSIKQVTDIHTPLYAPPPYERYFRLDGDNPCWTCMHGSNSEKCKVCEFNKTINIQKYD